MRCVLLHPHPDLGGNQHNNVIAVLFDALEDAVRFDFVSSDLDVAAGQVVAELTAGRRGSWATHSAEALRRWSTPRRYSAGT